MDGIIGHERITSFFYTAVKNGTMHHAYCLVGPKKVGKRTVALHVAAELLGCHPDQILHHPDILFVQQEKNEKTGKTKKSIDVDQIRNVRDVLKRTTMHGGYKIAIIDDAHKMNASASNALLKTLEEPTKKTVLFLIIPDESALLETIRSRCHLVYFHSVRNEVITNAFVRQGMNEVYAKEYAAFSRGLPGYAIEWSEDQELFDAYKQEVVRFEGLVGLPFHEKIAKVEELFGDKKDHIATRQALSDILRLWQLLARDILCEAVGTPELQVHTMHTRGWSRGSLAAFIKEIDQAISYLHNNIHPRLLVERLLLHIP